MKQSHTSRTAIYSLIFANLVSIVFAVYYHWGLGEVILLFWAQNIIIGVFTVYKLWIARNIIFSGADASANQLVISRSDEFKKIFGGKITQHWSAILFGFQFFAFNAVYLIFFRDFMDMGETFKIILIPLGVFFVNHMVSFWANFKKDSLLPIKYKQFTSAVFIRVLPIHLFLIFGSAFIMITYAILGVIGLLNEKLQVSEDIVITASMIIFILLKTFVEVIAHLASHLDSETLDRLRGINTKNNLQNKAEIV